MRRDDGRPEPVTADVAAKKLRKKPATIRTWVTRFNARRLGRYERYMYYDLKDLRIIEREIEHGHTVPLTWQERKAISQACPFKAQELAAQAAA